MTTLVMHGIPETGVRPVRIGNKSVELVALAGFCVLLLLIASIGFFTVRNMAVTRSNIAWVDRTHEQIEMLDQLEVDMREAESAIRLYLLDRNDALLQKYRSKVNDELEVHLHSLHQMVNQNASPDQQSLLNSIDQQMRKRVALMEELRVASQTPHVDTAQVTRLTLDGERLSDEIARKLDAFAKQELRSLDSGIARRESQARFGVPAVVASGVIGIVCAGGALYFISRGLRQREQIEGELRESLAEKEILLKEVHHRVKNNLQVVSGLLSLEAEKLKDAHSATIFKECRDRIHSMARLHQQLYGRGRFAHVDFGSHLQETAEMLVRSHAPTGCDVVLETQVEPIELDLDLAVNLGLIANELILNSLKHAFAGRTAGLLRVDLHAGTPCALIVSDNGCGIPPEFDVKHSSTLGIELVSGLTGQIRGEFELRNRETGGAVATVRFNNQCSNSSAKS